MYVVSRHADVEAVFRDPETYSAANAQDPVFPLHPGAAELLADAGFRKLKTMSNNDGESHTRIRRHTQVGFAPRRLKALDPVVRRTTTDLVDRIVAQGSPADFVANLCFPLPASIVFALIGFPPEDTEQLKIWAYDRLAFSWGRPDAASQAKIAQDMLAYWGHCVAHTARRIADPQDDFTSDLARIHLADPDALSEAEIAHVIYGISFAGHETTTNLLANTLRRVLESPGLWAELAGDADLVSRTVDEVLRFDSSVIAWRRVTTRPTTLGGVELPVRGQAPADAGRRQPRPRRLRRTRAVRPPPRPRAPPVLRARQALLPRAQRWPRSR